MPAHEAPPPTPTTGPETPARTQARPAPSRQDVKVLIADDNFHSRQLLARMLQHHLGAEIHEARDGAHALQQFDAVRPQLTFLDIDMPEKDGLAVLKAIRELDPQCFVVMVSAYGALEQVQAAAALGVVGFVVKPYSAQRILDVLRRYAALNGGTRLLHAA